MYAGSRANPSSTRAGGENEKIGGHERRAERKEQRGKHGLKRKEKHEPSRYPCPLLCSRGRE